MHSEIFDEFVKIVKAKDDERAENKSKTRGTLSAEEIAKLYGLKPETHKDMEYDHNIVEIAHPETMVMVETYDKINGMIGNQNENHSIIKHVINKNPRGMYSQKLAEKDLTLSLVRTATMLDQNNKDDLMVLADTCLSQIGSIKKKAFLPLLSKLPLLLKVVMTGLSVKGLQDYFNDGDVGFYGNHDNLVSELNDLVNSNTNFGVGRKYSTQFVQLMQSVIKALNDFKVLYDQNKALISSTKIESASDVFVNQEVTDKANESLKKLADSAKDILGIVMQLQQKLSDKSFVTDHVMDRGALTNLVDKNKAVELAASFLLSFEDDVDDVLKTLGAYKLSVERLLSEISGAEQKSAESGKSLLEKLKNMTGENKAPDTVQNNLENNVEEDAELADLLKSL